MTLNCFQGFQYLVKISGNAALGKIQTHIVSAVNELNAVGREELIVRFNCDILLWQIVLVEDQLDVTETNKVLVVSVRFYLF